MASLRTGTIKIVEALAALSNAATGAPTSDANGIAVPDGFRHEYAHIIASKENTAQVRIWGQVPLSSSSNLWVYLDDMTFSTTGNEASLVRGVGGMLRLCAQRLDANTTNTNCFVYVGFHEAHGVG